jgi:hypothetical protein
MQHSNSVENKTCSIFVSGGMSKRKRCPVPVLTVSSGGTSGGVCVCVAGVLFFHSRYLHAAVDVLPDDSDPDGAPLDPKASEQPEREVPTQIVTTCHAHQIFTQRQVVAPNALTAATAEELSVLNAEALQRVYDGAKRKKIAVDVPRQSEVCTT